MPADTNPAGNIFGGWIVRWTWPAASARWRMPAGGSRCSRLPATDMAFLKPVKVGDVVCVYCDLARIGRTSLTLHVEAWALRQGQGERIKVTSADFASCRAGRGRQPRPVAAPGAPSPKVCTGDDRSA